MIERISGSLLDPQSLYIRDDALFSSTELRGLNLVMGFTGFADAGHVVRQITAELLDTLDAEMIAEFDADQLIDYRSRRPHLSFVEDHIQDYQEPRLALYRLVDGLVFQRPKLRGAELALVEFRTRLLQGGRPLQAADDIRSDILQILNCKESLVWAR